jgi:non-specific serine/threonine protein kinase
LEAEPQLGGADQDSWFRRLSEDQENLRVAIRTSLDKGDAETALRFAGSLWLFWRAHGDIAEGRSWLREALALKGGSVATRTTALWGAAWLAYHRGEYEDAAALGDRLFDLSESGHDPIVTRHALTVQGMVAMADSRYEDARASFERTVHLLRPIGQNWLLATSLMNLGTASVHTRDGARARELLDEAIEIYEKLGDRHFSSRASVQLGFAWMVDGDLARASELIGESIRTFFELEDRWGTTESIEAMAAVRAAQGAADRAARIGGAGEALRATLTVLALPFEVESTSPFMNTARATLGEEAWQRAWEEGRAMSLEDAVDYALEASAR